MNDTTPNPRADRSQFEALAEALRVGLSQWVRLLRRTVRNANHDVERISALIEAQIGIDPRDAQALANEAYFTREVAASFARAWHAHLQAWEELLQALTGLDLTGEPDRALNPDGGAIADVVHRYAQASSLLERSCADTQTLATRLSREYQKAARRARADGKQGRALAPAYHEISARLIANSIATGWEREMLVSTGQKLAILARLAAPSPTP
jgi:hypothetical protein